MSNSRILIYNISRWAKELERTLNEIAEVKEKLAFKTAWCRVLQKDLGITRWQGGNSIDIFGMSPILTLIMLGV